MQIPIKTSPEIKIMREGGQITGTILAELIEMVKPGLAASQIEKRAEQLINQNRVKPAFKGFSGYPFHTVVCVNEEVVHGMPTKNKVFEEGDVVTIDFGTEHKGFFTDTAKTKIAGQPTQELTDFIETGQKALNKTIQNCRANQTIGDLSHSIQETIEKANYSTIRTFVGHGIGRKLHEPPQIPGYGNKGTGEVIEPGMVLAVEVMYSMGDSDVVILDDGWTAVMADGSTSGMFEHTVAVTENGPLIITKP